MRPNADARFPTESPAVAAPDSPRKWTDRGPFQTRRAKIHSVRTPELQEVSERLCPKLPSPRVRFSARNSRCVHGLASTDNANSSTWRMRALSSPWPRCVIASAICSLR